MSKVRKRQIPSTIAVPCFDFSFDGVQREKRTVVIAPIVIEEIGIDKTQIAWACSRGPYCEDKECRYSRKGS